MKGLPLFAFKDFVDTVLIIDCNFDTIKNLISESYYLTVSNITHHVDLGGILIKNKIGFQENQVFGSGKFIL